MRQISTVIACLVTIIFIQSNSLAQPITLATNGKAKAVIVLGADATKSERYAASELALYLEKSTGGRFQIMTTAPKSISRIYVGQTGVVKQLLKGFDWSSVRKDGIVIKTIGSDLVLSGDRPRGSLYAVYTFLEDQLGVRWWTPEAESVPKTRSLIIGTLNTVYKPPFIYREEFSRRTNDYGAFAARLKLDGNFQQIPAEMGGHYNILGWCHTFNQLLPPDKYFKEHPDWYSEVNGKRTSEYAQLCLTNPEMKNEFVKQALEWIKKSPNAEMISVAQNDWQGACECANCKALVEKTGSQSGALITFVNSVAEEIEKQYPDILIETLAYQYTRKAPQNVKPRKNVVIRLCSIECDFAHPLTADSNKAFYQDLQDCKKISQRVFISDYVVNFSNLLIPHPNLQVLGNNLRTFAANNVTGIFEEGDGYNPDAAFASLKAWVISKLIWDPRLNERSLVKEYLRGYYGPAAPYIAKYLDITEKLVANQSLILGCLTGKANFFTPEAMYAANQTFISAENAVKDNPELLKRVKIQRLALQHLLIISKRRFSNQDAAVQNIDWQNIGDDYLKLSDETGNVYIGENLKMSNEYRTLLRTNATAQLPPTPARCKSLDRKDWTDCQEDQYILYNEGIWVKMIDDESASNKLAVSLAGNTTQWALQIPLSGIDILSPTMSVYASVKVKANAQSGPAFTFGVADPEAKKVVTEKEVTIDKIPDANYHEYYLGDVALKPGMYIYFAPPGDIKQIESVTIHRVYLLKG